MGASAEAYNKITFFGCSLDGESAFEVVDRSIQLRGGRLLEILQILLWWLHD